MPLVWEETGECVSVTGATLALVMQNMTVSLSEHRRNLPA